jgi:hypothetical protein
MKLLAVFTGLLLAAGGALGPIGSVAAQTATTIIQLESPSTASPAATKMMVNGWAADPTGRGAGVDLVQVYLGDPDAGGQDLGQATYGQARPDVARTLGDQRFTNSGFQLAVEVPPGQYTLYVYAHLNTAGPDDGWASFSTNFTASSSVRPDPQAAALLSNDQPQIRTAAPPAGGSAANSGSGNSTSRSGITTINSSGFSVSLDSSGGIRTTASGNDPIPLDPVVPGMASLQGGGQNRAELADPTGSGAGIRQSVISEGGGGAGAAGAGYRTGQVTMVGGGGNTCPGPNCPANTGNLNSQIQQLPSSTIRDLTGYGIPGLGNNTPCTPSNGPGGCNAQTGTSALPGAPTGTQLLQQQAQTAQMQGNNTPMVQSPTNPGPPCSQTVNGQCAQQQGAQGPLGSTCMRFVGQQCAYYGAAPATPGGPPQTMSSSNPLATTQGACAQWSGAGQCMTPAAGAGTGTGARNDGFIPGLATTYPPGVLSPAGGGTSPTSSLVSPVSVPSTSSSLPPQIGVGANSPSVATAPAGYAGAQVPSTSGGVCLQFSPTGACTQYR